MSHAAGPTHEERAQLRSSYILRDLGADNEAVKAPQRERAAAFIARHHAPGSPFKYFGMPGVRWSFERLLAERLVGRPRFLGVERNFTILRSGLPWMPGRHRVSVETDTASGTFRGVYSDDAEVVWCDASRLMNVYRVDLGRKLDQRVWARRYKSWTCAWLDFQSQLCDEIIACVDRVENHLHVAPPRIPVVITFMLGREERRLADAMAGLCPAGGLGARVAYLLRVWENNMYRDVHVVDAWSYESAAGCNMAQMLTVWTPKPGSFYGRRRGRRNGRL